MDRKAEAIPTDIELVRRFRDGDEGAFDLMVLRYRKAVYGIARRITGDHGEADDLAQETFCRAYTALADFRGECSLRSWLCRIASNLSLNVVQSARVTRREDADLERAHPPEGAAAARPGRPELALLAKERDGLLREAIRRLPERQRETVILRVFEALPYKEIAAVMQCSVGTAKANFFHAVTALKRDLEDLR